MFDLGWTEMMLIGIVALIVVGPKELPGLFRTIGHAVGRARGMAREFSRAMEAAADETGMKEIDRTIRAAARPAQFGKTQLRDAMGLNPTAARPAAAKASAVGASGTAPAAIASAIPALVTPSATTPAAVAAAEPPVRPAVKPGGSTETLAAKRAEERTRLDDAIAKRRAESAAAAPDGTA